MKKMFVLTALLISVTTFSKILEGTGEGYKGPIKVAVTMDGEKISKVEILEQQETRVIWRRAVELCETLVGKTSTKDVEVVAGATYSSEGIFKAVEDALSKK